MEETERSEKLLWGNVAFLVFVPVALLVAVPLYISEYGLSWANIITFALLYWATGISITAGYHRLFSHRAYKGRWPARLFFAIFGAAAFWEPVIALVPLFLTETISREYYSRAPSERSVTLKLFNAAKVGFYFGVAIDALKLAG